MSDIEDLGRRVEELSDYVSKLKRDYDDLLNNLDDDNFSVQTIKEKEGFKSQIIQNADEILLRVLSTDFNGDNMVSKINMSSSKISMSALNIDFSGYVTFSSFDKLSNDFKSLSSPGSTTTIDGGNISTDNLYVKAIRNRDKINEVYSKARAEVNSNAWGNLSLYDNYGINYFNVSAGDTSVGFSSADETLFLIHSYTSGMTYAQGDWNFNDATLHGITNAVAVFG